MDVKTYKKGDVLYLKEGINKLIARGVVTREYYYVEDKYSSRIGVNWELIETIVLPNNLRMSQHTLNRLREDTKQFIDNYNNERENIMIKPIQKIYIGPPGSGKSYKCKNLENVTRIVFHPEYENSDFIGSLLPVTNNGNVTYDFVPGPFAKILKKALNNSNMQYNLLIEEMTRGNCAAIFGEVFQLLDRDKETGNSQYAINHNYLEEYLNVENIILPSNLNIIGTVNSSDQNVFPMDTAFKRRFKLEYVKPIEDNFEKDDFEILGINWSKLCKNINRLICNSEHLAEDKQIGFYFINKPNNQIEMVENIQKLCIYLWHDVDKFIHETNKKILNHKNYNNFGDFTTNVINFSSKLENIFSTSIVKQLNYSEDIENEPS